MNKMIYTYELKENAIVFRFDGEFTNENAGHIFDKALQDVMENGKFDVIMNMERIDTINSRVAGGIAGVYEKIDTFGGNLYVTNMNSFVDDTLDLLGMYLFLRKAENVNQAIKLLNS